MSADSLRQFVDTNILIYAHDRSAGHKHVRAKELVTDLWTTKAGCLSIQVLQEFFVNVTRKVSRPLAADAAGQVIASLSAWEVHRPNVDDVLDAIQLQERYQVSFWDAMIISSAQRLDCETLWSEDLNAGQRYHQVTVVNPFA